MHVEYEVLFAFNFRDPETGKSTFFGRENQADIKNLPDDFIKGLLERERVRAINVPDEADIEANLAPAEAEARRAAWSPSNPTDAVAQQQRAALGKPSPTASATSAKSPPVITGPAKSR